MSPYVFDLNFPCEILNKNFVYKHIKRQQADIPIETCLSAEILNFFQSLNLKVTSTELFFKFKNPKYGVIHYDDKGVTDRARLNCVIEDINSSMGFFKPKNGIIGKPLMAALHSTPIYYDINDVELVYQHRIKKSSIIQTAIPHAILNPYGIRYSLAVYFLNKNNKSKLTFNEAMEIFKEYIIK
jgi:hypothetical protein